MQASRWIAVWMAVGAFGIAATGAGCGDDGDNATAGSTTTTTTGGGSTSSTSNGGAGGTGTGGAGGAGTGGDGGTGTGGDGGTGTGGDGGTGTGGAGGTGIGGAGGTGIGGSGGAATGGTGGTGIGGAGGMMDQRFAFTMNGVNFTGSAYVDKVVNVTMIAVGETAAALDESATISGDGTFTITGQVPGGVAYTLRWYVDVDDSGGCESVPPDRAWMEAIPTVTADVTRRVEHNTDFAACP